jgi:homoserine kinase
MRARVPGSSANLGPGFDTLGLALSLSTEVTIEPADRLCGSTAGEGSQFPLDGRHLAVRIVNDVLGHDRVRITITSDIPVSRGLGSSASLAVAVAAATGHPDPLGYAARLEGHADNAAAAALGGFVTATIIDGKVFANRLPLDPELTFVAVIPERHLSTSQARGALPAHVPLADAVANLGAMGLLIAGMADHRRFDPAAGVDRLHQPYRTALFPESAALLAALLEAGALTAFWSGAGPTLLGVCHRTKVHDACAAVNEQMVRSGVAGSASVLEADTRGLVVTEL